MNDTEELMQAALAHHHASRLAQAESGYRAVLERDPAHLAATYNLGIVLRALGRAQEALGWFARAAALQPANADAQYGLGHMLRDEDRLEEAAACFRRALELAPDFAEARWSLALCTLPRVPASAEEAAQARAAFARELEALDAWFASRALDDPSRAVAVVQPFNLAYHEAPNRALLERYGALCARLMQGRNAPLHPARAPRAPLRVGIVSSHFRHHSVWHALVKGWLQHLDASRISLHGFYLGAAEDAQTEFARSRCESFVSGQRDWAAEIGSRRLDALIYPELGMDTLSFRLASLRLAPLQAVSWGHPETSGLPTIDCFLSADLMEPPEAAANYSERLVRLPNLGCWFEERPAAAEAPDPGRWGIDPSLPLLVCPGVPFKYAPQHDWVFAEIAARLGECRFVFFAFGAEGPWRRLRERLVAAFERRGLAFDDYVSVLPWQTNAAFLGWLCRADVFLDTIGFSGFNTASQAIQCGLPVVTREGRFLRGRLASGPLKRIGLEDLVAPTEEAYVELAVRLVEDGDYSEAVEARIEAGRRRLFGDLEPIRALERFLLA